MSREQSGPGLVLVGFATSARFVFCCLLLAALRACRYYELASCSILSEQSLFKWVFSGGGHSWVVQPNLINYRLVRNGFGQWGETKPKIKRRESHAYFEESKQSLLPAAILHSSEPALCTAPTNPLSGQYRGTSGGEIQLRGQASPFRYTNEEGKSSWTGMCGHRLT